MWKINGEKKHRTRAEKEGTYAYGQYYSILPYFKVKLTQIDDYDELLETFSYNLIRKQKLQWMSPANHGVTESTASSTT